MTEFLQLKKEGGDWVNILSLMKESATLSEKQIRAIDHIYQSATTEEKLIIRSRFVNGIDEWRPKCDT